MRRYALDLKFALVAVLLLAGQVPRATAGDARTRDDAPIPLFDHVIMVIMENHSYAEAISAPYTASLAQIGASFSNSHAITHPSQPNYLALWCGSTRVTNDNCPPAGSPYIVQSLGHLCDVFGLRWRSYSESLPAPGSSVCSANGGLYVRRHCPWTDFSNSSHLNERTYADFATDVANDSLPALSVIIPDLCNDGHNNCDGYPIAYGDNWLAANVPQMLSAMGPRGLFILTWDEDDFSASNQILTLFVGNLVAGDTVSQQHLTHYTVLKTICEGLGLPPFAAAAAETSVTGVWLATAAAVPLPRMHSFGMSAVRPNPSRTLATAHITLPAPTGISADVLDIRGRRVRRIDAGVRSGEVDLGWDGRDELGASAPGGIYFMRVEAFGRSASRKFVRLQ